MKNGANQYYVLRFEFSGLDGLDEEHLRNAFYAKVHAAIRSFVKYYEEDIRIMKNDTSDSAMMLNYFLSDFGAAGKKLYILIDEYDHFVTNIVENPDFFHSVTGRSGFARRFYEVIKEHTGTGCVDRMFITGVTSMALDSLTSGFNISKNISMDPRVNAMMGFTKSDTASTGTMPRQMSDANIKSDYGKLTGIFDLYQDAESRTELIRNIIEGKPIEADIVTDFSFFSDTFGRDEFLSMLFYMGLLTIKEAGSVYDVVLETPNAVIRDVYYKYYADYIL